MKRRHLSWLFAAVMLPALLCVRGVSASEVDLTAEQGISTVAAGTPRKTPPVPTLNRDGRFIATAAFGFYSAQQVQLLRDFRDRYLLTNAPGRTLVAWYHRHGSIGARHLDAHPSLKAPVRFALLPLIAISQFLLYTPSPLKLAAMMVLVLVGVWLADKAKRRHGIGRAW